MTTESTSKLHDSKRSVDGSKRRVDDSKRSVDDSKRSVDDSKRSVDDSKRSVDDSKRCVDDSKRSVDDSKRSVEHENLNNNADWNNLSSINVVPSTVIASPRSNQHLSRTSKRLTTRPSFGVLHYDSVPTVPSEYFNSIDKSQVPWFTSKRFRLAVLTFFGFLCLYSQRVNLSIAMVAMVSHEAPGGGKHNESDINPKCPVMAKSEKEAEFHWTKDMQGLALGAFFWGYLILQVAGGRLSEKFGAKKVIAYSMFPVAILDILSPLAARWSPYALIVLRVLMGVGESTMYPSVQALWARWSPPNERSQLVGLSYAGGQFGNALMFPIAGILCEVGADGGWPTVFYFVGAVGLFWTVLWVMYAHDTPDEHPTISEIERRYINFSLGATNNRKTQRPPVPWCSVLKSSPFWAILVGHVCGNYGAYMLLTKIPTYMKEVLKFDIKANGLYSMMPYLAFWAIIVAGGYLADMCITKEIFSVGVTRKLFAFLGFFIPAITLIGVGFMDCDQAIEAVVLLTLSVGFCGLQFCSVFVTHADIAPKYAGTLFGLTNTMATIPGIVSPYVVSEMTPNGTREEWQKTFYLAGGIYLFGALWYCLFSKSEIQPWALDPVETEKPAEDDAIAAMEYTRISRKSKISLGSASEHEV